MKEERLQVLRMIQEGIISAEEGAALLAAMKAEPETANARRASGRVVESSVLPRRRVRIQVIDKATERHRVNLTIPMGLLDWGLRFAESAGVVNLGSLRSLIYGATNGGELLDIDSQDSNERVIITVE